MGSLRWGVAEIATIVCSHHRVGTRFVVNFEEGPDTHAGRTWLHDRALDCQKPPPNTFLRRESSPIRRVGLAMAER